MPEDRAPLLVYNRIDHNRKVARRLLASFALTALPVVSAGGILLVPFVSLAGGILAFAVYGRDLEARIESLNEAASAASSPTLAGLPRELLMIIAIVLVVAAILTLVAFAAATAFLIARFGARMVLRLAGARPARQSEHPELFQVVENLCIGAGLPTPAIYLVDSAAPNAFATGRRPSDSSVVVTRGLLALLDRRALEGVIAHELSHIGNHDVRLTTMLAAVVGTLSLPIRLVSFPFRRVIARHAGAAWVALPIAAWMAAGIGMSLFSEVTALVQGDPAEELPLVMRWYAVHALLAPAYALAVAPVVALAIRQAVSRQREFLADADAALLTRDPDGLAQALTKIAAATGPQVAVGEGRVHLYIVDPHASSLLHRIFPSHPPLSERIRLLSRMGSGAMDPAHRRGLE